MMCLKPITFEGSRVRLEPLTFAHAEALYEAGSDPILWKYMTFDLSQSVKAMTQWIERALEEQRIGYSLPFAVIDKEIGKIAGSTRYMDIDLTHKKLEIGWTWLAPWAQKTRINTECKYLLLKHAFESLGCLRVQFKTDNRNEQSKNALIRLGAVREGVLRKHMILHDGSHRDSIYFSVLDTEWNQVKHHLEKKLQEKQ